MAENTEAFLGEVSEVVVEPVRYIPAVSFQESGDLRVTFNHFLEDHDQAEGVPLPFTTFTVSPDQELDLGSKRFSRFVVYEVGRGLGTYLQSDLEPAQKSLIQLGVERLHELTRPRNNPS